MNVTENKSFETIATFITECVEKKDLTSNKTDSNQEPDRTEKSVKDIDDYGGEISMEGSHCCNKRLITFIWATLECLFFTGIVFGWVWLAVTLRRDMYFLELCNITLPKHKLAVEKQEPETVPRGVIKCRPNQQTTTSATIKETGYSPPFNDTQYFCDEQEDRIDLIYAVVIIVRNFLTLPVGFFMDKYGTTRTRLLTVLTLVLGTLMMTFSSSSFPWLVIPAFVSLSLAGLVVLITNLQVSNLFGDHRYTVMATLIGAYHASSFIMSCVKATHDIGIGTRTSFMFLTIAIVPILVSTIAFLPKTRIPWPLPATYGNRNKFTRATVRSKGTRDARNREDFAAFRNVTSTSLFAWSVVWFSVHSLRQICYEGNFRILFVSLGSDKEQLNTGYSRIFSLMKMLAMLIGPCLGYFVDWKRNSSYNPPRIQQMYGILCLVVLTSALALLNSALLAIPSMTIQIIGFVLQIIESVAVLICICCFLTHVHFPVEHFGKYVGCHFVATSIVDVLLFLSQYLIRNYLQGQPFYVNLVLLILSCVSFGHPLNIWYHCKQGLIHDSSETNYKEEVSTTERLVEEDNPSTA